MVRIRNEDGDNDGRLTRFSLAIAQTQSGISINTAGSLFGDYHYSVR